MDELILSFTPSQYEKYREILSSDKSPCLDFCTKAADLSTRSSRSRDTINKISQEIVRAVSEFSATLSSDSYFSHIYSREELESIRNNYFAMVREISRLRSVLLSEVILISHSVAEAERIWGEICISYNDFLPYKAALCDHAEHSEKISMLDKEFKKSIAHADTQRKNEQKALNVADKICNAIIPEFLDSSSSAADSPSFTHFNAQAMISSTRSLSEQIRIILNES